MNDTNIFNYVIPGFPSPTPTCSWLYPRRWTPRSAPFWAKPSHRRRPTPSGPFPKSWRSSISSWPGGSGGENGSFISFFSSWRRPQRGCCSFCFFGTAPINAGISATRRPPWRGRSSTGWNGSLPGPRLCFCWALFWEPSAHGKRNKKDQTAALGRAGGCCF